MKLSFSLPDMYRFVVLDFTGILVAVPFAADV